MLGKEFKFEGKKLIAVYSPVDTCTRCVFAVMEDYVCNQSLEINEQFGIDCANAEPDFVFIKDTRK